MKMRNKLMAASVMLVISIIMMSTASFAWFTISTAPEISGISTNIVANENLEIALDDGYENESDIPTFDGAQEANADRNVAWGNLVDLSEVTGLQLKPVSFDNGTIKHPVFGADGRIDSLENMTTDTDSFTGVTLYKGTETTPEIWAFAVTFWMRSNVGGEVKLTTTGADRGTGETGNGTAITGDEEGIISIVFYDQTDYVEAMDEDGAFITSAITSLEENVAKKVTMYVFVDGETTTNANLATLVEDVTISVQFTIADLDDAMTVPITPTT